MLISFNNLLFLLLPVKNRHTLVGINCAVIIKLLYRFLKLNNSIIEGSILIFSDLYFFVQ